MSEFGEILKDVGEFGQFQKRLLVLICIPYLFTGFHLIAQVFTGATVQHHCQANWIQNITEGLSKEEQLLLTIPKEQDGSYQKCKMYVPHPDKDINWILLHGNKSTAACEEGWMYDFSQYRSTIVTEFNLVCDHRWLSKFSQTSSMAGLFVGAMLFGPLADRFGRQRTILVSLLLQLISGVGAAFVPTISLFIVLQFVLGTSVSGIMMNTVTLGTEWTGVEHRSFASVLTQCALSVGQILLTGLAYGIRDWRMLQLTTSCPIIIFLSYIWLLPESARWLLMKGQKEAAKKYLRSAAIVNKRVLHESLIDKIVTTKEIQQITIWDLFRISSLRRVTLVLTFIWFVNSFVYYGLCFSVERFSKDIYLMNFIFGLVEVLRVSCIWLLAKFGRKKCQGCFLLLGGVACLLILAFPEGMALEVIVLAVLAKLSISGSFSVTYVYSTELFPTAIRQSSIGLASMFAWLGGIIAPMIMLLEQDYPGSSLILFGITSIIASALSLLLPETANKELSDHTGQVGNVKKKVNGKSDVENAYHQSAADTGNFTKSTRM
ncbi:solute carrier family 22 member 13b [Pristis pectinata]|uniref:solute carrier family 22 member 13b n=1 Tax=Pristis pectinata TaxID=685728 RepID=UPI00223CE6E1|nr:solute carrier family 22 member 13b [Pristis pectinata]